MLSEIIWGVVPMSTSSTVTRDDKQALTGRSIELRHRQLVHPAFLSRRDFACFKICATGALHPRVDNSLVWHSFATDSISLHPIFEEWHGLLQKGQKTTVYPPPPCRAKLPTIAEGTTLHPSDNP